MKILTVAAALGVLCLPLAAVSTPALAASAHNSQLGGMGDTRNNANPSGMHKRMKQMRNRARHM